MILWLDAQLPPGIARWIHDQFGIEVHEVRDLGLRDATAKSLLNRTSTGPERIEYRVFRRFLGC